jgi:hypothetical protein
MEIPNGLPLRDVGRVFSAQGQRQSPPPDHSIEGKISVLRPLRGCMLGQPSFLAFYLHHCCPSPLINTPAEVIRLQVNFRHFGIEINQEKN